MPKLVCISCNLEMYPKKNGVYCVDLFDNGEPYSITYCDIWKCNECGYEVLAGFANEPCAYHWQPDFGELLNKLSQSEIVIKNRGRNG